MSALKGSAMEMVMYQQSLTVRQSNENPVFIQEHVKANVKVTASLISLLLQKELAKMNFRNTLTEDQCVECTGLILDKYRMETLEDLILAFRKFTLNQLPGLDIQKFYKIGIPDVIKIIDTYMLEVKIPDRERMHRENKPQAVGTEYRKAKPETVRKMVSDYMKESREAKEAKKKEASKDKPMNPMLNNYSDMIKELAKIMDGKSDDELEKIYSMYPLHQRKYLDEARELLNKKDGDTDS